MSRSTIRNLAVVVIAGALLAALITSRTGTVGTHHVSVVVAEATNVVPGQSIRLGGRVVGEIGDVTPVDGGRAALLDLNLEDEAWPLRRTSRLQLRTGGSVSYANRYVALTLGADTGRPLPDGAALAPSQFFVPTELDDLTSAFTPRVRRDLKAAINRGGRALHAAGPDLRRTLDVAPAAVDQTSHVLGDLIADQQAFATLLRSGGRVVDAVARSTPDIGALLSGTGQTFTAIAAQSEALKSGLERMPATLSATRATLRKADGTLTAAGELTGRLSPGVSELRRTAAPLNGVLKTLVDVGPDAQSTLRTARTNVPKIDTLLQQTTKLLPIVSGIGKQAANQVQCVRPYAPDIAGFVSNWGDFTSWADKSDRVLRATAQFLIPAPVNAIAYNSADLVKANPQLRYAFPRPPGYNAGKPFFLPECGITRDALDPSKDPESRPYDPAFQIVPPTLLGRTK